jgi:hypothetical protein
MDKIQEATTAASPYVVPCHSWLDTMEELIHQQPANPNEQVERTKSIGRLQRGIRPTVQCIDWHRTQEAISRRHPELQHVTNLLAHATAVTPYLWLRRTTANMHRTQLRLGERYLLRLYGKERKKGSLCPHCSTAPLTVPHLLRDCPARMLMDVRTEAWTLVKEAAVAQGVMSPETPSEATTMPAVTADHWYRFMVGAPVPTTFLDTPVFGPMTNTPTKVTSEQRRTYADLLQRTDNALCTMVESTRGMNILPLPVAEQLE